VDGIATMAATTTLDRRDFGMGTTYPDQSSVGFSVDVNVALTALEGE
jgi:polyisoprenoid-binding protein YceI